MEYIHLHIHGILDNYKKICIHIHIQRLRLRPGCSSIDNVTEFQSVRGAEPDPQQGLS